MNDQNNLQARRRAAAKEALEYEAADPAELRNLMGIMHFNSILDLIAKGIPDDCLPDDVDSE